METQSNYLGHPAPQFIDTDQALALMPYISAGTFKKLRREGSGPKFGIVGNSVKYRTADVLDWYAKYEAKLFTQTKLVRRGSDKPKVLKTAATTKAKAKTNGKNKAPTVDTLA